MLNLQSPHSHNDLLNASLFWNAIEKGLIIKSPDLRFQKRVTIHRIIPILIDRQQRWEISECLVLFSYSLT